MIQANQLAYVAKEKLSVTPVAPAHNFRNMLPKVAMLWGDPVYVISTDATHARVSAKGHHLDIELEDLMETPLLEVYQIDVGQGDSALIHTPDDRWVMIDGGPLRRDSNTGRVAADFLAWKMFVDQSWKREFNFQPGPFVIDALICTHPDSDHFGGFHDLNRFIRQGALRINTVFINGMGRFKSPGGFTKFENGQGFSQLGPIEGAALPDAFLTTLLNSFADVRAFMDPTNTRDWVLHGQYRDWLGTLLGFEGQGIGDLQRLHHALTFMPGYGPQDNSEVTVYVLGPLQEQHNGQAVLRYLDTAGRSAMSSPSLTRNGQSVVLRFDYGDARILFTGDLNFKSQALLLNNVPAAAFRAHVAKACHHGSEDISTTFLQAIAPFATMISSGDNEGHVHPRALMMGLTGAASPLRQRGSSRKRYLGFEEPRYEGPLIYSTELSRSVRLRRVDAALDANSQEVPNAQLRAERPTGGPGLTEDLDYWMLADEVTYGLINVRTDGDRIRMAVLKEDTVAFQVESFRT